MPCVWQKNRSFFFSLEMPAEQIMQRLLSDLGNVSLTAIRSASLEENDWECLGGAMSQIAEWGASGD
ncbi:DnaB-like helicase C-terminal domain-containing protein [Proteus mirabilis]